MNILIRVILIVAGSLAALFVARDALNFPIITGVIAILLVAAVVVAVGFV
jgi:hypothetical protein